MKKISMLIFIGVAIGVVMCGKGFSEISFKTEPFATDNSFADLFMDSQGMAEWYQLWTADAWGAGSFVDTSAFNEYGNGWIQGEDLSNLQVDFVRAVPLNRETSTMCTE